MVHLRLRGEAVSGEPPRLPDAWEGLANLRPARLSHGTTTPSPQLFVSLRCEALTDLKALLVVLGYGVGRDALWKLSGHYRGYA